MASENHEADSPHGAVLLLCSRSGNMGRPWARRGFEVFAVDLEAVERTEQVGDGVIHHVQADVREYTPPERSWSFAAAFPPCTHLAVSGARWMQDKGLHALAESIETVAACRDTLDALGCPWLVENPVSTLSTYWREPDYRFDPFEYDGLIDRDEAYTKRTWLWTGGGFRMPAPATDVDEADADDRIHRMAPGEDRAEKRAETPTGFAEAVYRVHQEDHPVREDARSRQADLREVSA